MEIEISGPDKRSNDYVIGPFVKFQKLDELQGRRRNWIEPYSGTVKFNLL